LNDKNLASSSKFFERSPIHAHSNGYSKSKGWAKIFVLVQTKTNNSRMATFPIETIYPIYLIDPFKSYDSISHSPRINCLRNAGMIKPIRPPNKQSTLLPREHDFGPRSNRTRKDGHRMPDPYLSKTKTVFVMPLERPGITLVRSDLRSEVEKPLGRS
jgi:hypothetical protein